jgi:hypothetical protein
MHVQKRLLLHSDTHNKAFVNYSNVHNIPAKLSRSAKQHPSYLAHFMSGLVRGLSTCDYQFSIVYQFLHLKHGSQRVPRVGRVWLA